MNNWHMEEIIMLCDYRPYSKNPNGSIQTNAERALLTMWRLHFFILESCLQLLLINFAGRYMLPLYSNPTLSEDRGRVNPNHN